MPDHSSETGDDPTIHPDADHRRRVDVVALVAGVLALVVAGGATVGRGLLGTVGDPRWGLVVVALVAGIVVVARGLRRR